MVALGNPTFEEIAGPNAIREFNVKKNMKCLILHISGILRMEVCLLSLK